MRFHFATYSTGRRWKGRQDLQPPRSPKHCSTAKVVPLPPQHSTKSTHRISRSRRARKAPSSMQLIWLLSSCLQKGRERMKSGQYGQSCLGAPGWGLPRHRGVLHPLAAAARHPAQGCSAATLLRLCWLLADSAARYRTLKPVRSQ